MKKKMTGFGKRIMTIVLTTVMVASLTACGTGKGGATGENVDNTVSVDTIYDAVKNAYGENYLPSYMLSEDEIQMMYGIEPDWCEEIIAEVPMISVQVDTFIAVKAIEDKVGDVENALTTYQENLKADAMQYPMNVPKIEASTVYMIGNYVFFIMLGSYVDDENAPEEAKVEAYKEQNQIAIDAIKGVLVK